MSVIGKEGLRAIKPRTVDVEVPELGGSIRLRRLSSREFGELAEAEEAAKVDGKASPAAGIALLGDVVARTWIDEQGVQVVTDDEGRAAIMEWPLDVLERANKAVGAISGRSENPVKDAEKNS
jgi:hypothetical protein